MDMCFKKRSLLKRRENGSRGNYEELVAGD